MSAATSVSAFSQVADTAAGRIGRCMSAAISASRLGTSSMHSTTATRSTPHPASVRIRTAARSEAASNPSSGSMSDPGADFATRRPLQPNGPDTSPSTGGAPGVRARPSATSSRRSRLSLWLPAEGFCAPSSASSAASSVPCDQGAQHQASPRALVPSSMQRTWLLRSSGQSRPSAAAQTSAGTRAANRLIALPYASSSPAHPRPPAPIQWHTHQPVGRRHHRVEPGAESGSDGYWRSSTSCTGTGNSP